MQQARQQRPEPSKLLHPFVDSIKVRVQTLGLSMLSWGAARCVSGLHLPGHRAVLRQCSHHHPQATTTVACRIFMSFQVNLNMLTRM